MNIRCVKFLSNIFEAAFQELVWSWSSGKVSPAEWRHRLNQITGGKTVRESLYNSACQGFDLASPSSLQSSVESNGIYLILGKFYTCQQGFFSP